MIIYEYRALRLWNDEAGRAEWQPQMKRPADPLNPYWKPIGPWSTNKPEAEKVLKAHEAYVKEGGK